MGEQKDNLKQEDNRPVLAICYDFDKTLTPDDMQAQGYIQAIKSEAEEFWAESNKLAETNEMDQNLAYMYKMYEKAHGKFLFTRQNLKEYGSKVKFFPGVKSWFQRIRKYGDRKGVSVEHYIISSGLKEMIEGTPIAKEFKKIYASSFFYDGQGVAIWPAQAVNYTNKTQFLFRIEKGVLDVNDFGVNDHFDPEDIRVPFRNMVYIGDSDTDIPCMKLVNTYGGYSIGVYNSDTNDKTKVYKMMRDNRIKYFAPADYSKGSELEELVKDIIDRTAANEKLESYYIKCKKEQTEAEKRMTEESQRKRDLINALENSGSFNRTHSIIKELSKYNKWTEEEKEMLFDIAINNNQVYYILRDRDLKNFYSTLLTDIPNLSENAKEVNDAINKDYD